jgi:hypothetical protein
MFEFYDVTATLSQFSFATCSNIKTGTNFNAGSFATIAISELQRAADAAAAAARLQGSFRCDIRALSFVWSAHVPCI